MNTYIVSKQHEQFPICHRQLSPGFEHFFDAAVWGLEYLMRAMPDAGIITVSGCKRSGAVYSASDRFLQNVFVEMTDDWDTQG